VCIAMTSARDSRRVCGNAIASRDTRKPAQMVRAIGSASMRQPAILGAWEQIGHGH
jgi:hypothetical protein